MDGWMDEGQMMDDRRLVVIMQEITPATWDNCDVCIHPEKLLSMDTNYLRLLCTLSPSDRCGDEEMREEGVTWKHKETLGSKALLALAFRLPLQEGKEG